MTKSLRQTLYLFILLISANIVCGVYFRDNYKGYWIIVLETIPMLVWCSFLFWISCQWKPKSNFRFYFLPLFRILFWTIIVIDGFQTNNRMNSEDFLYFNNGLFIWWNLIKDITQTCKVNYGLFEIYMVDIISIALVQFSMILTAVLIDKRVSI